MASHLVQYMCVLALVVSPIVAHSRGKYVHLEECSQVIPFGVMTSEISRQLSLGELPNVALELKEGVEFPATFLAKVGFVSIAQDPHLKVNLERNCYFRFLKIENDQIRAYMSFDLVNWKKSAKFNEGTLIFNVDKNQLQVLVTVPERLDEDEERSADNS